MVTQVISGWKSLLARPGDDQDRLELLEDFQKTYDDLAGTEPALPEFKEIAERLPRALKLTLIEEVNSRAGATPKIDWKNAYSRILIGGQAMDRGFTVEGLTVTYMPRGIGVGNADTVQQRARFFGYKRPYPGLLPRLP